MSKIYLVGRITGLSQQHAANWRRDAAELLAKYGHDSINPMDGKEGLGHGLPIAASYRTHPHFNAMALFHDSVEALNRCDAVLMNCEHGVVFGAPWELGAAYQMGKTAVLFNVPDELQEHPMIAGNPAVFVVDNLEQACGLFRPKNYA